MDQHNSLVGTVLIAPPGTQGEFAKSVILVCGHDEHGAVGLTINKKIPSLYLDDLLVQLNIPTHENFPKKVPLFSGGEMDMGRGFVLHSTDYNHEQSIFVTKSIFLTATMDVLARLGDGSGPRKSLLTLGYTNWEKDTLEQELKSHQWLWTDCSDELVFSDNEDKWETLINEIGRNKSTLGLSGGRC